MLDESDFEFLEVGGGGRPLERELCIDLGLVEIDQFERIGFL